DEEGQRLTAAVRSALSRCQSLKGHPIVAKSRTVYLPHRKLPSIPELQVMATEQDRTVRPRERSDPEIADKIRRALADWAAESALIIEGAHPLEPVLAEIQVIRVGDFCLVGISGEPFFSFARSIGCLSPVRNTWVLGYWNAYSGYHPTARAFEEGGYEVSDS